MTDTERPHSPEELAKHEAEAELFRQQARQAAAEATVAEIKMREAERKERDELADREHRQVYFFGSDVSDSSVSACIKKLDTWAQQNPGCDMEIIFKSPGGGIFAGVHLFDFIQDLRRAGHTITTGTYGMAASMAGILLQAGDHRWMGSQSWLMIHRASLFAGGSMDDLEDAVKFVRRIERNIEDIFVSRSGGKLTRRRLRSGWNRRDWWLSPSEASDLGLVDEVRGGLVEFDEAG